MTSKISDNLENLLAQEEISTPQHLMDSRRLEKLNTALMAILSSTNQQEIQEIASSELKNIISAKACSLSIWDKERDIISFLTEQGFGSRGERNLDEANYCLEEQPLIEFVLKNNEVKNLTAAQPGIDPAEKKLLDDFGVKSLLLLPLLTQNQVFGLIGIYDENERSYNNDEILIAKLFSHHVAVAIDNARLYSEAENGFSEQKMLNESALIITSSLNLNTILTKLSEQICNFIDASSVNISSFNPESRTSKVLAEYYSSWATDQERVSDLGKVYSNSHDFHEMLEFFQTGGFRYYHIDDPDLDEKDLAILEEYGGKSVLEIPLKVGGEFNATIAIWDSRDKREFTKNEISICQAIALQAAIAIENANLYIKAQEEIKSRKIIEEKLKHDALHDSLTDLPNRNLLLDRLEQAIFRKKRFNDMNFSVVYVDLDRFKNINDVYGHSQGDKVLIQIGRILKESVREVDTVSRFGGDEFILILEGPLDLLDAKGFAERIQENLNKPIKLGDHELIITASIGVVLSSRESNTAEDLIRNADIAMYYAKANGKGRCEIYSSTLGLNAKTRMELESELQQALINNEYLIYYQPIIDLKTARLDGFEALLRWQKKDGTLVYPNDILPVLENTGLIKNVGYWTLNEVCKQIMLWQNMYLHLPQLSISMNVSLSSQISHPKFIPMIRQSIEKFGIDANRLIFEITENIVVHEISSVAQTLKELQKLGVRIHLDSFGTGYSALGHLTQLPINSIKIDRIFINRIVSNDEQKGLLKTMLTMAKERNIDVVAEGIEKKEQLTNYKKLGCDYGQGNFFKEGQNIADTEKYLMNYVTDLKKI